MERGVSTLLLFYRARMSLLRCYLRLKHCYQTFILSLPSNNLSDVIVIMNLNTNARPTGTYREAWNSNVTRRAHGSWGPGRSRRPHFTSAPPLAAVPFLAFDLDEVTVVRRDSGRARRTPLTTLSLDPGRTLRS